MAKRPVLRCMWDWLDGRYQLTRMLGSLMHVDVPRTARTYYLGGITLFFFLIQAVTGSLLVLYYQPSPDRAYDSVHYIMNDVGFGWFIRSIHAWGANLMVLFCVFHLLRIFLQGVYKAPREVTWVVGCLLLVLTLGFGFTGFLLPWDQRAFWATTAGSEIAGGLPVIGEHLLFFIRGGTEVTARTLSRFFGVHVLVLPASLLIFLGIHLALVRQQGLADPAGTTETIDKLPRDGLPAGQVSRHHRELVPFFPHYVLDQVIAWYTILAVLIVLASLFPPGLEEQADPLQMPVHTKPEWYFLALYQGLKILPRTPRLLPPVLGAVVLVLLPFVDHNPHFAMSRRPIAVGLGVVAVIGIVGFTIWGWLT